MGIGNARFHLDSCFRALQIERHTVEDLEAQEDTEDQARQKVSPWLLGQVHALHLQRRQLVVWGQSITEGRVEKGMDFDILTEPPICAWKPFGTETGRISGQCCDEEDEQRREARLFCSRTQSASDSLIGAEQQDVSPMTWWSSRLFASHIKDVTALGEVSSGLTHRTTPPCRSVSPQGRQLVEHAQGLSAERVPGLPHCPECINSVAENNNKRAVACMFCSRDVKRKFIIKSLKRVTIAPAQVFTRVPGCNPICLVSPAAQIGAKS
jgi:hypothetical protein